MICNISEKLFSGTNIDPIIRENERLTNWKSYNFDIKIINIDIMFIQ